uniref:Ig-like domain-containing protein n=1 Tax=Litorivivens sp. TaxID=2020868 RepID=UPI00356A7B42
NTTFSVVVPAAAVALLTDGTASATVTGTDDAGNPFGASDTRDYTVDTTASATIEVDNITADDVVSAQEAADSIVVTGSVGGDAAPGDTVSFTINQKDYSGFVLADGTFAITVEGSDLAAQTSFVATVSGSDDAGNVFTATTTSTHQVPPQLDLDGDTAGTDYATSFSEGAYAVSVADSDIVITDVDSANLEQATIKLTNAEAGDVLIVGALPAGISASTYDPDTGVVTLTGTASLADYQLAIRAIQYENNGSVSDATREIEVVVSDGQNVSNPALTTISLSSIPTVTIDDVIVREPATGTATITFTVTLDKSLATDFTFDFVTTDVSATGGQDYQAIALTQGVVAAGSNTATISVTINADSNIYEGDETFSVDLSNFSQTVNFATSAHTTVYGIQGVGTIAANGGAPNAADDGYLTAENTPLLMTDLLLNDTIVDGASITAFTQGSNGTVTDNGDGTYTYTPQPGFAGTDSFTYTLTDSDGEMDTATVTIAVGQTSQAAPVVDNAPDTRYVENDVPTKVLGGIQISDADSSGLSHVVVKMDGFISTQDSLVFATAGTGVSITTSVSGKVWSATLTGGADINEYLGVLQSLTYFNASDNPSSAPRLLTVEAYDESMNNVFGSDSGGITVIPVNDAPDAFDNTVYVEPGSQDNAINISAPTDPDADDDLLTITITDLPTSVGSITLADGSAVAVGDTLTLEELGSLQFDAGSTTGTAQFSYEVSDGSLTSSASTTLVVGETNSNTAEVFESALPGGTGMGSTTANGNLLADDPIASAGTTIDSINGVLPTSGVITLTTSLGTLTVYASDNPPNHSAGDYTYVLNGPDSSGSDVEEIFSYTFTENGVQHTESLKITVVDDAPFANPINAEVSESAEQIFNVVVTMDTSGSMNWSLTNNSAPPAGEPSRLDVSKDALKALAAEFFNQSSQVSITLIKFASSPTLVGTYSTFSGIAGAVDGLTAVGSTDYVDALDQLQSELASDLAAQNPADNVQNISYFISDGVSSSSPIGGGFDTFVNSNGISSYAVGVGPGMEDGSADLNFIHNVDALQKGGATSDDAIFVADINELETELLNTVPVGFGGSVVITDGIKNLGFGADEGYVSEISMNIGGTDYTFSYDGSAISVTPALAGLEIDGATLIIGPAVPGFDLGTFSFDFADAEYTLSSPSHNVGNSLVFDYTVQDGDGDLASATATINIVDGVPLANHDLHSELTPNVAEGNVINALGTDGGPTYGANISPFSTQGGGIDKLIDDADITQVTFRDQILNLDFDAASIPASGAAGSLSWQYSVTQDVFGNEIAQVVINDSADNAQLTFNSQGYYRFSPDTEMLAQFSVDTTSQANVDAANFDIGIRAGGHNLVYNHNGVGVEGGEGQLLSDGEAILVSFDSAALPQGVRDLVLTFDDFQSKYGDKVRVAVTHDSDGDGVYTVDTLRFSAKTNGRESLDLSQYSAVTSVDIEYIGSGKDAGLFNVSYRPQPAASLSQIPPELISYVLTDSDGQSDSAYLSLYNIDNTLTGTDSIDSIAGGDLNDAISGGLGADILDGGKGNDILSGGEGNDSLLGRSGNDYLSGGEGNDSLLGGAGADFLIGGDGDDSLEGGDGNDVLVGDDGNDVLYGGYGTDQLEGGAGNDMLLGGAGNDSLLGDAGSDSLIGGAGNDHMTGGSGPDTFIWYSNDKGSDTNPAQDTVLDFTVGAGGDVLHLADLLQGEENGPLTDYLSFQADGAGSTVIAIHTEGSAASPVEQYITLQGIDLTVGGTVADQTIIDSLLNNGNLVID